MRRLSLPFVLACFAAACGGGSGTGPTPGPSSPSARPTSWSGPVKMSTTIKGPTDLTIFAEGHIFWLKDDSDVVPLTSGTLYTPVSGSMTVTYHQVVGGCSEYGVGSLSFSDKDGAFVLEPNGTYSGDVKWRETPPFPTQVTCGPKTVTRPAEVVFLEGFKMTGGIQADGHLKGGWSRVGVDATYAATWDLTPD